ncbi:semaphorin-4A isoform X2 [Parambassis ranga]|uniref:Semaphorin-4A isoform X2 n=1 Tax=Parambassis ranga TaxID=210632 RepID=A0A6P7I8Q4_9TELE|nr:semaphorin-4A-like isoform X2 [Parambassis ranga]
MESHILSLTVALLGFLSPCLTRLTPRVSFPMGSPGRHLTCFHSHNIRNTTTLLLSEDGDWLYVGARDAVLALDVSNKDQIHLRTKLDWSPSDKDLDQCSMKGKKMADCNNFIRVLQFLNTTHIYACGTFAFSPRCTYINSETVVMSFQSDEGRGRCPYDPYQRNTAVIVDEELYTGTVADYRGNRPVISRHLSEGNRVDLKLDDTLGWLEDPTFISSRFIPEEEKIYFFFSEVGTEYDFIDKFIVSRVSQICTSDVGGQRTLQRRWTTFAKAQLLCQADNELPYNVIQDIDTLPPADGAPADDTLFYGIFTSQWSVNSGRSAVCSFRLADIKSVFSGNYKVLNRDTLQWSARVQEKVANPGECGLHNASDNALRFVKENFLADDSVHSVGRSLTLVSADSYSHLTVQRVRAANSRHYIVLFLLTESGYLHKVVLLQSGAHIIEEVQVFEQPQPIKSLKLSIPKGMIYIGTSEGVVKIPTANCSFYWTCAQCVLSRDPFCGWDSVSRSCVGISDTPATLLDQDIDRGNVEEACNSVSLTDRTKFGPNKLPGGELVSVSLNEVVRLQCPAASRLSRQLWERPNSRLSSDLYLHLEDGSLSFVATPTTLGHYLCLSTENGYQQTMAIYHVKQKSSPIAQTPTSSAHPQTHPIPTTQTVTRPGSRLHTPVGTWPKKTKSRQGQTNPTLSVRGPQFSATQPSRNLTSWTKESGWRETEFQDGEPLLAVRGHCHLKEIVVLSVLLVLCLSLLITMGIYVIRPQCHSRTTPQADTPARDIRTPVDQGVLRENEFLSKCNRQASGHVSGLACNRTLTGSNSHLPNTPI